MSTDFTLPQPLLPEKTTAAPRAHEPGATPALPDAASVAAAAAPPPAAPQDAIPIDPPDIAPPENTPALDAIPRSPLATTVLAAIGVVAVLWWGQRFLVPVVAGVMLSLMLAPCVNWLERPFYSRSAAVLVSLALFVGIGGMACYAFGGQVVRMVDRSPEMIHMLADRLAQSEPDADSVLKRSRDALQQLDRAAQSLANGSAPRSRPRHANAAPSGPTATITEGATVVLRETAKSGSTVLMKFAADLTIVMFVAFFVLSGGAHLAHRFVDLWDGGDDLLGLAFLVQVTARALAQQRRGVMRLRKPAQNEHRQFGRPCPDGRERIDAALLGHGQIHHEHVDQAFAHDIERIAAIPGLGHHLQVDLLRKKLPQPCANQGVIVNDGDFDHVV